MGWAGYAGVPVNQHDPQRHRRHGRTSCLALDPSRCSPTSRGWARGVYHGLRRKYLQTYLDEFVFRFNRRRTRHATLRSLFAIAIRAKLSPTTCWLRRNKVHKRLGSFNRDRSNCSYFSSYVASSRKSTYKHPPKNVGTSSGLALFRITGITQSVFASDMISAEIILFSYPTPPRFFIWLFSRNFLNKCTLPDSTVAYRVVPGITSDATDRQYRGAKRHV